MGTAAIAASLAAQSPAPVVDVRLVTAVHSAQVSGTTLRALTITSPLATAPALPAGCELTGTVAVEPEVEKQRDRTALRLAFSEVRDRRGQSHPITSRLIDVDNARETVTDDGVVIGLERLRAVPTRKESLLLLLAYAHPLLLVTAEGVTLIHREVVRPGISYDVGTEMRLMVTGAPPDLDCGPRVTVQPTDATWPGVVAAWPARTTTGTPPRDADWINIALAGSREAIAAAFERAGWLTADRLSINADVRTFLAVAADRGYKTGPVSILQLNRRDPDLVYQKQNNTFARRHHIRIWSVPDRWQDRPLWMAAATHDVGIEFSRAGDHFTHRIDAAIDDERAKVAGDLAVAGAIQALALVPRPNVPRDSRNGDGDAMTTDGRIAILTIKPVSR